MRTEESRIDLPERPTELAEASVATWHEAVVIDSYAPEQPDRYPAYLDRRVYQGSSGRCTRCPSTSVSAGPSTRRHGMRSTWRTTLCG